jgi:serine/threonine protein kinase/tetratricopeptide (TPR) repeat protein
VIAPADDPRLDELLLLWEELRDQGQYRAAEELCSTCPELAGELARRIALLHGFDPLLEQTRNDAGEPHRAGTGPGRSALRDIATAKAEYRELRFHAAGALGEVFLARNAELNREVALKFLKPGRSRDPDSLRRFLREAEITSRLEHPGIVPIYALGSDKRGVPCYAMRFVRGETLQGAIDAFHAADRPGRDPGERSLALRELLNRFVSICGTVGYAHSRGILHRDLKPRNVMLGKYDETLVVDWGLAKPFNRNDDSHLDDEPLTPSSGGSGPETPTVGVVGTLAYMSPEQAMARSDLMGPASDLFSLGAILYAILTGRPPYQGGGAPGESLERVKRCEFPRPRQVKPDAPRALEAVCLKAMARAPAERYATAREMASDVLRWLADEPVTADTESLSERASRWIRRHQRLVTGAAAAALVGILALAGLVVVVSGADRTIRQKNTEIIHRNQDLEQARAESERERDQAREVTEFLVSSFRKADPAQDGRTLTVAEVLDRAVQAVEQRPKMAPTTAAAILSAVSETYHGLGMVPENVQVATKALALRRLALGGDHLATLAAMNDLAVAFHGAGQFTRAIELHEQVLPAREAKLGADHPDTLTTLSNLAAAYWGAQQFDRAIELHQHALDVRTAKLGADHPDTLTSMNNLASTYYSMNRFDRAIALQEQALEARRAKLGPDHPDTLASMTNLAVAYLGGGQVDRAIPLCERTLEAQKIRLGDDHPDTLTSQNNLAAAYERSGQRDRAISLKEHVVKVRKAKLGEDHPDTVTSMIDLSMTYWAASDLERVIPLCEQVLKLRQSKLGEDHPDTLMSMHNLALARMAAGQFDRLVPFCEQAVAARQSRLGEDHPVTLTWMSNLAQVYERTGQRECAIPIQERVVKARRSNSGADHPDTLSAQRDLAASYLEAGRYQDAKTESRNLVAAVGHGTPRNDPLYCESLAVLGSSLSHQQEHVEALSLLGEGLKIMEKNQPDDWATASYRSLVGEALCRQKSFAEAERLLLAGQRQLAERSANIPPHHRQDVLRRAVNRLVALYEVWDKPAEAQKWRKRLPSVALQAPNSPIE